MIRSPCIIEPWGRDVKVRALATRIIAIWTIIIALQNQRGLHATAAWHIAGGGCFPAFLAAARAIFGHPALAPKKFGDGSISVEFGTIGISRWRGEHGVGMAMDWVFVVLPLRYIGARTGSARAVPVASSRGR